MTDPGPLEESRNVSVSNTGLLGARGGAADPGSNLAQCDPFGLDPAVFYARVKALFPDYDSLLTMFDMDGVLTVPWTTPEPEPWLVQPGSAWDLHLCCGKPLYVPASEIFGVCSGRLERYRTVTRNWLRGKVGFRNLWLSPHGSAEARNTAEVSVAQMKGQRYRSCRETNLFIESEHDQSVEIARVSKKPVFCVENLSLLKVQ